MARARPPVQTFRGLQNCYRPGTGQQNVDGRHRRRRSLRLKRRVARASRQRGPMRRAGGHRTGRPCVRAIIAGQAPAPPRNGRRSTSEPPTMPPCSPRSWREKLFAHSGRRGLRRATVPASPTLIGLLRADRPTAQLDE